MISEEKLAYYLSIFKGVTPEDFGLLFSMTRERSLAAGEVYIDAGSESRRLAYVKKGLIRVFMIDAHGEEKTLHLRWEDQFFAGFDTILWQRPSRFVFEAFEDTILLETDYQQFMEAVDATPGLSAAKTFFLQSMLAESLERVEGFVLLRPEERYLRLLHGQPDLAQRVPDKHLASLLGITPVSLSRIRKRLAGRRGP